MDLIVQVQRLPKPGETVAGDTLMRAPGGKGANQAVALLHLTDVVICNEHELAVMLGRAVESGAEAAGASELRTFADQLVVVTLGQRGALAISGDHVVEQPAFPVRSIDSTGAGDAFV